MIKTMKEVHPEFEQISDSNKWGDERVLLFCLRGLEDQILFSSSKGVGFELLKDQNNEANFMCFKYCGTDEIFKIDRYAPLELLPTDEDFYAYGEIIIRNDKDLKRPLIDRIQEIKIEKIYSRIIAVSFAFNDVFLQSNVSEQEFDITVTKELRNFETSLIKCNEICNENTRKKNELMEGIRTFISSRLLSLETEMNLEGVTRVTEGRENSKQFLRKVVAELEEYKNSEIFYHQVSIVMRMMYCKECKEGIYQSRTKCLIDWENVAEVREYITSRNVLHKLQHYSEDQDVTKRIARQFCLHPSFLNYDFNSLSVWVKGNKSTGFVRTVEISQSVLMSFKDKIVLVDTYYFPTTLNLLSCSLNHSLRLTGSFFEFFDIGNHHLQKRLEHLEIKNIVWEHSFFLKGGREQRAGVCNRMGCSGKCSKSVCSSCTGQTNSNQCLCIADSVWVKMQDELFQKIDWLRMKNTPQIVAFYCVIQRLQPQERIYSDLVDYFEALESYFQSTFCFKPEVIKRMKKDLLLFDNGKKVSKKVVVSHLHPACLGYPLSPTNLLFFNIFLNKFFGRFFLVDIFVVGMVFLNIWSAPTTVLYNIFVKYIRYKRKEWIRVEKVEGVEKLWFSKGFVEKFQSNLSQRCKKKGKVFKFSTEEVKFALEGIDITKNRSGINMSRFSDLELNQIGEIDHPKTFLDEKGRVSKKLALTITIEPSMLNEMFGDFHLEGEYKANVLCGLLLIADTEKKEVMKLMRLFEEGIDGRKLTKDGRFGMFYKILSDRLQF